MLVVEDGWNHHVFVKFLGVEPMSTLDRRTHWENVYTAKGEDEVSIALSSSVQGRLGDLRGI